MDLLSLIPSLLSYDAYTGVITRKVRTSSRTHVGQVAGRVFTKKNGNAYRIICVASKEYYAHRLAFVLMTGQWPVGEVDHINGNGVDNRWCNLRDVPHAANMKNLRKQATNTSGHTGVSWHKNSNRWRARIVIDGKYRTLGYFRTIEEAVVVRKQAEIEYGYHPNHGSDRLL